jgi:hypothetical protein
MEKYIVIKVYKRKNKRGYPEYVSTENPKLKFSNKGRQNLERKRVRFEVVI